MQDYLRTCAALLDAHHVKDDENLEPQVLGSYKRLTTAEADNAGLIKLIEGCVVRFESLAMPTSELQFDLNEIVENLAIVKYHTHLCTAITQRLAEMEEVLNNCITELELWEREGCDCSGEVGHICGLPRLQRSIEKAKQAIEGIK